MGGVVRLEAQHPVQRRKGLCAPTSRHSTRETPLFLRKNTWRCTLLPPWRTSVSHRCHSYVIANELSIAKDFRSSTNFCRLALKEEDTCFNVGYVDLLLQRSKVLPSVVAEFRIDESIPPCNQDNGRRKRVICSLFCQYCLYRQYFTRPSRPRQVCRQFEVTVR